MKKDDRECLRLVLAALVNPFLQRRLQNVQEVDAARQQRVTQLAQCCRVSFDVSLHDGRSVHFDRNRRGLLRFDRLSDRDNEVGLASIRTPSTATNDKALVGLPSKLVEVPRQHQFPPSHKEELLYWLISRVKRSLRALLEPPLDSAQKILRRPSSRH